MQRPTPPVTIEQTWLTGQPFPPVSWQPGTHRSRATSQMRPDVTAPQSPSLWQPHCPPVRHREPARSGEQAVALAGVQVTQVLVAVAQRVGAGQSLLVRHETQAVDAASETQTGAGAWQPASPVQPWVGAQRPTPPVISTQVCPVGQSLRGAGPQPGPQLPPGDVQMMPEVGPPQAGSAVGPAHPHRPVAAMHWGLRPKQSNASVAEHSVQAPASGPVCWQAGRVGSGQLGAPSAVHPTQVRVEAEQTGVTPPQSVALRQPTQRPAATEVSQSGAPDGQREGSAALQTPQAPLARQSGVPPPQSLLPLQGRQVPVASHTGVAPEQSAPVRHCTQRSVGSQVMRGDVQAAILPGTH